MTDDVPTPGSAEAVAQGCRCPVIDNARGKGLGGGEVRHPSGRPMFVYDADCPLHGGGDWLDVVLRENADE